jgi:hypothetical protein
LRSGISVTDKDLKPLNHISSKRVAPSGPDTWLTPRRTGGSAAPEYATLRPEVGGNTSLI